MSTKIRYYITPSNLASYFGVGFNSPEEQFRIDSGQDKADFDDESIRRMELGNHLEESAIEYFQNVIFKVPIVERNTEVKWGYDGKIRYILDGIIQMPEEDMVFENKISNAVSGRFTDNMAYIMQIQAYMYCEDKQGAVLAGLYQGKPIYKIFKRDEEMITDILKMTDFVVEALTGLVDFYEDFPVELLEKYSLTRFYEPIEDLSLMTVQYLHKLAQLQADKKLIEDEIKELNRLHENDFEITEGTYEDDVMSIRVSRYERKGGFDLDKFKEDNPYMDLDTYMKPPTQHTLRRLKLKEPN